ncbi:MAG: hypothetical protein HY877_03770 [Deltaproteobacteria bacterium]|nr:hypothetical protein [Deltaproteobacteria bacterium]
MKTKMKNLIFIILIFCTGCGSENSGPASVSFSETKGGGNIQLTVFDSKNPNLSKSVQISKYKVVLDGEGLTPLEQTFSQDAGGAVIAGIPVGQNRRIQVSALNEQGKILREGMADHIAVEGGKITDVPVTLHAIPTVLNVSDNDHVSNQRLYFQIFSDPKHAVTVTEDNPLPDILTSLNQLPTDEQGVAKLYPGALEPGEHHFIIQDVTTGKSSSLTLNLWDGSKIKGAPLFTASTKTIRIGENFIWKKR